MRITNTFRLVGCLFGATSGLGCCCCCLFGVNLGLVRNLTAANLRDGFSRAAVVKHPRNTHLNGHQARARALGPG